jgi:RNA polymerase sigma-70 factor (ECF subfamily)
VHNRCLHFIDHCRVVENYARELSIQAGENMENPSEIMYYKELQEKVAAVIEKLPERCGKIFCMSRFEGLKYSEIAQKLSISVKTVEANMGRALREFRKVLSEP